MKLSTNDTVEEGEVLDGTDSGTHIEHPQKNDITYRKVHDVTAEFDEQSSSDTDSRTNVTNSPE